MFIGVVEDAELENGRMCRLPTLYSTYDPAQDPANNRERLALKRASKTRLNHRESIES